MKHPAQPRIFIGPHEVAGYYTGLAAGFRQLGLETTLVGPALHKFSYATEAGAATAVRHYESTTRRLREAPGGLRGRLLRVSNLFAKIRLLLWALRRHDVFIFGAGVSFLPANLDLPLLKFLGKITISYIGHGSESRAPYLNGALRSGDGTCPPTSRYASLTRRMARHLGRIQRHATYTLGSPLTAHFLRARYINTYVFGVPFHFEGNARSSDSEQQPPPERPAATRILHAPSNRPAKGSDLFATIISRLQARGHPIDYVELHRVPHARVLEELARCDFVLDQAYSDYPLAGLATEAAFFGKPAIVGGYCWDELGRQIPPDNWPPSRICHPDELESAIEGWLLDPEQRRRAGRDARAFVAARWTPVEVARRYLRLMHNDIPADWWRDPAQTPFTPGGFAEIDVHRGVIRRLIETHGRETLNLDDKPALRDAVVGFAASRGEKP